MQITWQIRLRDRLEDQTGALMRVTGVLSARGSNIVSLHMDREPQGTARVTIVADVEERLQTRILKEMNRLKNVTAVEAA
jgi:acetolactate synthase small subunit